MLSQKAASVISSLDMCHEIYANHRYVTLHAIFSLCVINVLVIIILSYTCIYGNQIRIKIYPIRNTNPGILNFKPFVDAPAAIVPFESITIIPI